MSDLQFHSIGSSKPGHYGSAGNELVLFENTIMSAWNVQGDPAQTAFVDGVRRLFEIDLPVAPNSVARGASVLGYWLGPTSWLLASGESSALIDFASRRDALSASGGALFDVSQSRVAYSVAGNRAPDFLASGCPLDFSLREFPVGACRQSVFHGVGVLIERRAPPQCFRVFAPRSFARDVWHGLCITGAEHGYEVRAPDRLA